MALTFSLCLYLGGGVCERRSQDGVFAGVSTEDPTTCECQLN